MSNGGPITVNAAALSGGGNGAPGPDEFDLAGAALPPAPNMLNAGMDSFEGVPGMGRRPGRPKALFSGTLQDGSTVRVTPPAAPSNGRAGGGGDGAGVAGDDPEVLASSMDEFETLVSAGASTALQVTREGPPSRGGRGWKGDRYKGKKVEFGFAGTIEPGPGLLERIGQTWGGGKYKIVGQGRDQKGRSLARVIYQDFPGEPKALTAAGDDPDLDDDNNNDILLGPDGDPVGADGLPAGTQLPPGVFGPHGGLVGSGISAGPQGGYQNMPGYGSPYARPGVLLPPSLVRDEEKDALRLQIRQAELKAEMDRDHAKRIEELRALSARSESQGKIEALMLQLMQQAAEDRKERAAEEERRAAREREERKAEENRLREERKAEEAREREERRYEEQRREREQKEREERERREREDRDKRETAAREDARREREEQRKREETAAREARQAQERFFEMQMKLAEKAKPQGIRSVLAEITEAMTAMETMRGFGQTPPSKFQEAQDTVQAVGTVLRNDVLPVIADMANAWRGRSNPAPALPAGGAAPVGGEDEGDMPAPPANRLPGPPPAVGQPPTAPGSGTLGPDDWLKIVKKLVAVQKKGNPPRACLPLLDGICTAKDVPYVTVANTLKGIDPGQIGTQAGMKAAAMPDGEERNTLLTLKEVLTSDEGLKWFAELKAVL